ncbi:MAG: hypothetical protein AB7F75_12840, partial [Planctomycetota bacterium]
MVKVSPALATGVVLRLILLGLTIKIHGIAGVFYEDSESFWLPFKNLWEHGVYSGDRTAPFRPDPLRPPLYPLFCALFSGLHLSPFPVAMAQVLLVYPLTHRALLQWLNHSRWKGFGSWFLALDVPHMVYGALLMPDTLFLLGFVLLLGRLGEGKIGWREGVLLGLMHLTRPFADVILVGVVVWRFWVGAGLAPPANSGRPKGRPYHDICMITLGFTLAISPWVIRNTLTFGEPFVSLQGPHTLVRTLIPALRAGGDSAAEDMAKVDVLREVGDIHDAPLEVARKEKLLVQREVWRQPWSAVSVAFQTVPVLLLNPERSSLVDMLGLRPLPGRLQFEKSP